MEQEKSQVKIPLHVGIIMDGNRRWAKERNLPTFEGHLKGYEKLKYIPEAFFNKGVKIVSVYAFSTENWSRSQEEVNYLMKLMEKALVDDSDELHKKGYRVILSGRIEELPGSLPEACLKIEEKTKNNTVGILNICINYGGRAELSDAYKKMMLNGVKAEQAHEGMIRKYLYHGELDDPDLVIRTSGEMRLSGFLLWHIAYSELLFLSKYWPDFERADVDKVLEDYAARQRRMGGN